MSVIEYVWLGGGNSIRSKTRVITHQIKSLNDIPDWNFDGSSTNQAEGNNSEIIIKPKALFRDPFRPGPMKPLIVLCDNYKPDGTPLFDNNRFLANEIFNKKLDEKPWFGLEQEYFLIDRKTKRPLGFPSNPEEFPQQQGQYYCSVGSNNAFGRQIVESHLEACLQAGVKISGINAEVAPGQWEFQVGPCEGIESGDHLWIARYLLLKIAEIHNLDIDFEPKPVKGEWNGSGCHINYSTQLMREGNEDKTGLEFIEEAINKLSVKHLEHMEIYGKGNRERMTGKCETASYDMFTHGQANRGASVRINNETIFNKKGYFEDRRPSSNVEPYLATSTIFKTTCLN